MGTMLLIVGWSAVVVWLNVRPRVHDKKDGYVCFVSYGLPFTIAGGFSFSESSILLQPQHRYLSHPSYWRWLLAANIAIGLLAVAVLTFASKYLVRAIVAGLRRLLSKPPPDKEEGPSESN